MNYLPPLSPSAMHADDKYLVINTEKNRIVESAITMERATKSASILNDHELRYGRVPCYKVVEK